MPAAAPALADCHWVAKEHVQEARKASVQQDKNYTDKEQLVERN